ncbi:MAG: septal ring factor EnvC (AmiA/AmiB activator) [Candidatus Latescibacterota bacterium]|jgi:septal ring factor EnvC (AmiA/AmiB activator)
MGITLCLILGFVAIVGKWITTYKVKLMRAELTLLEAEREQREDKLSQLRDAVQSWKSEREVLSYDVRGLNKDLKTVDGSIEKLEGLERKIADRRDEESF